MRLKISKKGWLVETGTEAATYCDTEKLNLEQSLTVKKSRSAHKKPHAIRDRSPSKVLC